MGFQRSAMTDLKVLGYFSILSMEQKCILPKQYELIARQVTDCQNLATISDALKNHTYQMTGYYSFLVHDPKERMIHTFHYRELVVLHYLCDEVLEPILDKKLIYDNVSLQDRKGGYFCTKSCNRVPAEFL